MGMKFLIVDDSANIRAFIRKVLSMTGLEIDSVREAGDGEEGLLRLSEEPADVVLSDINMPRMDGLEMIRRIKARSEFAGVRIVVVSTEGSRDKILEAVKCGAAGYLKKPFGPEQVVNLLTETMKHGC